MITDDACFPTWYYFEVGKISLHKCCTGSNSNCLRLKYYELWLSQNNLSLVQHNSIKDMTCKNTNKQEIME